ncbi:hypothetical protein NM208_g6293 [Fusarium decemcellulare]|uniref:Uncharacterized protein n=1 Tax=Fusarium decemcellulare TaxID=57161 RepID=A0ACC1SDH0_9HYPO|nr:hypothetical protein NM208_g6293 [Fusarium decemcellulare]
MLPIVKASAGPKVVPVLLAVGSATVVGGYVRSQLRTQSRTFDRYFSQYNTKESEAVRQRPLTARSPTLEPASLTSSAGNQFVLEHHWNGVLGD